MIDDSDTLEPSDNPDSSDDWYSLTSIGNRYEIFKKINAERYVHREVRPLPGIRPSPFGERRYGPWIAGVPEENRRKKVSE